LKFPKKDNIIIQNPFTRFLNGMGSQVNVLHEGQEMVGEAVTVSNEMSRAWVGSGNDRA
jgi:hypothetical protein